MRVPTDPIDPLSFQLDHGVRTTELTANTLIHPNTVEMMVNKEVIGTRTGILMVAATCIIADSNPSLVPLCVHLRGLLSY